MYQGWHLEWYNTPTATNDAHEPTHTAHLCTSCDKGGANVGM